MTEQQDKIKIENMIYEIRGKQVMLDSDLARLYGVETKRINEAVKNNSQKGFPLYCLRKNMLILRSKISTSKIINVVVEDILLECLQSKE